MAHSSSRGPAYYPPLPFHTLRVTAGVSCTVVTAILVYFCYQLKSDGFKLPWTFLIVLMASVFDLLVLITTLFVACRGRFSPLVNVLLDIPILLLWIVAFSILTYNIYGMLGHSCSLSVWAADEGVSVCHTYKILYTFVVFSVLSQLALVVMDVKARRMQVRDGKYNMMDATTDIKLEPTTSTTTSGFALDHDHHAEAVPGWRSGSLHDDKKHGGVVVEEYPVQAEPYHEQQHQQHQQHFPEQHQQHYPEQYQQQSLESHYGGPPPSHYQETSPQFQQHQQRVMAMPYAEMPQSNSPHYQPQGYPDVHERSRTNRQYYQHEEQQQGYEHHSQNTAMYDSHGQAYHNDGRY